MTVIVYVDGGCKGNGTHEARGYGSYCVTHEGEVKAGPITASFTEAKTNNLAEYAAVLLAFQYIEGLFKRNGGPLPVEVRTDSQLVYGQLTLGWKVKAENLRKPHSTCRDWLDLHKSVKLVKVGRSEIVKWLGH